jgi:uncharacterized protein (TIGR00645 family)
MTDPETGKPDTLRSIEVALYAGRLLLVPMALGLLLGLAALLFNFFDQAVHVVRLHFMPSGTEEDIIIEIIKLVDYFLLAGLLVMVAVNGYDFFVSHIHVRGHKNTPDWVGAMGIHGLKMNLFITISAISSFQLLQIFFDIVADGRLEAQVASLLPWLFGLHALFLLTAVVIAALSRVAAQSSD